MSEQDDRSRRGWRAVLERFRDRADLKEVFVSIAIAYLSMEIIGALVGPLPPAVFSLGGLAIAIITLFGLVPALRRGRWRP